MNFDILPIWPAGTRVMLREDAPAELRLLWGSESVFRVVCHAGIRIEGRVIVRNYWLTHCHRGWLCEISEEWLREIPAEAAQGQEFLYREQVREAKGLVGEFLAMLGEADA